MAVSAAMYSTLRTEVLPPAMVLRPRIMPESRLIGATLSPDAESLIRRSEIDVEAIFGHVDADEDGGRFVHDPTLRMRAQAQAAVRVWDCEGGGRTKLCPGLASPRRTRADPHLQPRRLRSGGQLRHTRRSVARYSYVKRA